MVKVQHKIERRERDAQILDCRGRHLFEAWGGPPPELVMGLDDRVTHVVVQIPIDVSREEFLTYLASYGSLLSAWLFDED